MSDWDWAYIGQGVVIALILAVFVVGAVVYGTHCETVGLGTVC
jgi:hypothetical protein